MKLKSETKQVIAFLKSRFKQDKTVLETCKELNLNYDMVCRGLQQLHIKQVINRDSRGPKSAYQYPKDIGLGDVIDAVEGIELGLGGQALKSNLIFALNDTKL
jgi:ribosomal protein L4